MTARPKALLIVPIRPARSGNGLSMRVCLIVEAIEAIADLDVVVVPVAGDPVAPTPRFHETTRVHVAPARASATLALIGRIAASERLEAFRTFGKPSLSEQISPEARDLVAQLAASKSFGLVVVMRSYMLPLAACTGSEAVVLDLDEDDLVSMETQARLARQRGQAMQAAWLSAEAHAMDALVARHRSLVSASFVSVASEGVSLRRRHPGLRPMLVRNAVAVPPLPQRRDNGRTLLFIGAFGHYPNLEGIEWFIQSVAPRLTVRDPRGIDLIVAGAQPPQGLRRRAHSPRIEIVGSFPAVAPLYAKATIAIAPMRSGGGARTKIIEAAAHGVACVTHRNSVHPDFAEAGWSASDAADFAERCLEALEDVVGRRTRERLGRQIAASYDRAVVIADIARKLAPLLASV